MTLANHPTPFPATRAHPLRPRRERLAPQRGSVGDFFLGTPIERDDAARPMLAHEPIEWPDEVELLVDRLETDAAERDLSREERALLDVYETVPVLESEDCLHEFWQSGTDHQRVINSFDMVGAATLVDPLNASRWCGNRDQERSDYSETEADYLATIEEELPPGMDELVDHVLAFISEELS